MEKKRMYGKQELCFREEPSCVWTGFKTLSCTFWGFGPGVSGLGLRIWRLSQIEGFLSRSL